jgi:hypothetical protein
MIIDADAEFHSVEDANPIWAETNFFGFYNAQEHLNIGVYALFRPQLGTVHSTISMNDHDAFEPWRANFFDHQAHLAIPVEAKLSDYTLANGLHVVCTRPNMDWRITYDDGEDTRIDVEYTALMQPFDIQDPDMDPITAATAKEEGFAWGAAYNGHFDQTGHFRGEVSIRGRRVPIDCVSTMDHSWGPRRERGAPNMSWMHAHVDDSYAIHAIWSFDHTGASDALRLNHGYAMVDGEIYGLTTGAGHTSRDERLYAREIDLEVTDVRGEVHRLTGRGLTRFPWQAWPNMVGFNVLAEWEVNGRRGHGELQDFVEAPRMAALNDSSRTSSAASA